MKVIAVKNNDFETVGIEVTASAKTVYSWGISPNAPHVWTKEIVDDDWTVQIFELVRIDAELNMRQFQFCSDFFEILSDNKNDYKAVKENLSKDFELTANKRRIAELESRKMNIIKNIG